MENFEITLGDVADALSMLKDKITRTPEEVPSYFIKRIAVNIKHFLVDLFNNSLITNSIPNQWKRAFVIPVFDQSNPANYRPISLTSSFSRLFELIIHKKILNHFFSLNLFSSNQFGFLPCRSSCGQMLKCVHNWYKNRSSNIATHVLYTDICKALDSVVHVKLIAVLKSYGVNPALVAWLENFLSGREQIVIVNDSFSSPCGISSGIPQGSIIGPLLF